MFDCAQLPMGFRDGVLLIVKLVEEGMVFVSHAGPKSPGTSARSSRLRLCFGVVQCCAQSGKNKEGIFYQNLCV